MKYFLIAGEASGDLHASHLISALRERDAEAEFRFYGGDLMLKAATAPVPTPTAEAAASGTTVPEASAEGPLLRHYSTLAYMGFIQVVLHARTILRGLADCKRAIADFAPDCVILVDYPGFNLKIARWVKEQLAGTPVYYYISPKIWAWKEYRIKSIRAYVDRLFSILPFEVDFYERKHHYPISYVGNPTYDEVAAYLRARGEDVSRIETFGQQAAERTDAIALLPGSRQQEIRDNLRIMLAAVEGRRVAIAAAPGIDDAFYREVLGTHDATIVRGRTYDLLRTARAALVTSGTATLEAALLDVPQVVCYKMTGGRLINWIRPIILSCRFISLVNLIADAEVVPELVAADMNAANAQRHLRALLDGPDAPAPARQAQLQGYSLVRQRLATPGAPQRAAEEILNLLQARP